MAKTFSNMTERDENDVLIVDALNLAFRWKHSGATQFVDQYADTVLSLANSYKCGKIILANDFGSSTYRKSIYPEYKGNRDELRAKQTPEEAEAFKVFFNEFERAVANLEEKYGIAMFKYKGVEADDIAAYLVRRREAFGINKIWLISSDADWDLLVSENVSRFSYVTRKEIRLDNWSEKYDVSPEEFISLKCLTGDKGDNVPGINQVGPKRAKSLIDQFGSAMDIYDAIPLSGSYVYVKNLNENAEQIMLNYQLMDLVSFCEEAVGTENVADIERRMINAN